MVNKVVIIPYNRLKTGDIDHSRIDTSFDDLATAVNSLIDDFDMQRDRATYTVTRALEASGVYTLLDTKKHERAKILDIWVTIGDNSGMDDAISLPGYAKDIAIKDNERSGKVLIFDKTKEHIHYIDRIMIHKKGNRRITVSITLEDE